MYILIHNNMIILHNHGTSAILYRIRSTFIIIYQACVSAVITAPTNFIAVLYNRYWQHSSIRIHCSIGHQHELVCRLYGIYKSNTIHEIMPPKKRHRRQKRECIQRIAINRNRMWNSRTKVETRIAAHWSIITTTHTAYH